MVKTPLELKDEEEEARKRRRTNHNLNSLMAYCIQKKDVDFSIQNQINCSYIYNHHSAFFFSSSSFSLGMMMFRIGTIFPSSSYAFFLLDTFLVGFCPKRRTTNRYHSHISQTLLL